MAGDIVPRQIMSTPLLILLERLIPWSKQKKKPNLLVRRTFCSLHPDDCGSSQILDGRRDLQGLDQSKAMDRSRRKTPPAWKQNSESIYSIPSPHPCHTTYLPLNRRTAALMGARVHYDQPRRSCEREKTTDGYWSWFFGWTFFLFLFFFFSILLFPFFFFLCLTFHYDTILHHFRCAAQQGAGWSRRAALGLVQVCFSFYSICAVYIISLANHGVAENEIEARKGGRVTSWAWMCIERRGWGSSSSISRVTVQKLASFVRREKMSFESLGSVIR